MYIVKSGLKDLLMNWNMFAYLFSLQCPVLVQALTLQCRSSSLKFTKVMQRSTTKTNCWICLNSAFCPCARQIVQIWDMPVSWITSTYPWKGASWFQDSMTAHEPLKNENIYWDERGLHLANISKTLTSMAEGKSLQLLQNVTGQGSFHFIQWDDWSHVENRKVIHSTLPYLVHCCSFHTVIGVAFLLVHQTSSDCHSDCTSWAECTL